MLKKAPKLSVQGGENSYLLCALAKLFLLLAAFFVCSIGAICFADQSTSKLRIRQVQIEIRELFDDPDIGWFYRGVNELKIATKEEVVKRELLFKKGDAYDPFLVEESERNLRTLPFFRQVSITPIIDGEYVDMLVSVQDTWTLFPTLNFSSGGGTKKREIGLSEKNLLGYGKRFEVLYADDEDREKIAGIWDDNRLFGSHHRLFLGHFQRSDGYRSIGFYGRPFRSLVEPRAWSANVDASDIVGKLFSNGDERFIFRERKQILGAGITFSDGDPEELLNRYTIGYEYENAEFLEADSEDFDDVDVDPNSVSQDPALLADNRRFSGPFIAYQRIEPNFLSINYVDRFDRIEDFNLGNELFLKTQIASNFLGSLEDTLVITASISDGWNLSPKSFVRGELGGGTRTNKEGLDNTVFHGQINYYNVLGPKYLSDMYIGRHTFASSILLDHSEDLDRDREFLLGASTGLRGYKDRTFTGSTQIKLHVEQRIHFLDEIARLVSLGMAVFADGGGTSNKGPGEALARNFYADVGLGLRLGFPRSSGGTVMRIDLAFPLREGPEGSEQFEPRVLVTVGQAFSARLRSASSSLLDTRTGLEF